MARYTLLIILMFVTAAGCQNVSLPSRAKLPWSSAEADGEASHYDSPTMLVAIWSDAIYNQVGSAPTRGFGGRIYFYNQHNEAIPVDGNLVIYAYDDTAKQRPGKAPDRKYVFTAEQLTQHYTPSDLGASYSVWVPWDAVGGSRRSVSLLPVFTTAAGQIVSGKQSFNVLPGPEPEEPLADDPQPRMEIPASYAEPATSAQWQPVTEPTSVAGSRRQASNATTINVSPATARRLRAAVPFTPAQRQYNERR